MRSRSWSLFLLAASLTPEAKAQTRHTILQAQVLGTRANVDFAGLGVGIGRRANGRLTYHLLLTPGIADGSFSVRPEAILTFSLDPSRRSGVSAYGGGGIAGFFGSASQRSFLVVLIGLESAPQSASGWFAEVGVGGGVRGAAGWRVRR